jgi:hypothetical protein
MAMYELLTWLFVGLLGCRSMRFQGQFQGRVTAGVQDSSLQEGTCERTRQNEAGQPGWSELWSRASRLFL